MGTYRCQRGHFLTTGSRGRRRAPTLCPQCAAPIVVSSDGLREIGRPRPDPLKRGMVLLTILWAIVIGLLPVYIYDAEMARCKDSQSDANRVVQGGKIKDRVVAEEEVLHTTFYQGIVWPTVPYLIVLFVLLLLSSAGERSR